VVAIINLIALAEYCRQHRNDANGRYPRHEQLAGSGLDLSQHTLQFCILQAYSHCTHCTILSTAVTQYSRRIIFPAPWLFSRLFDDNAGAKEFRSDGKLIHHLGTYVTSEDD
jgi:hypothetical protein